MTRMSEFKVPNCCCQRLTNTRLMFRLSVHLSLSLAALPGVCRSSLLGLSIDYETGSAVPSQHRAPGRKASLRLLQSSPTASREKPPDTES